MKNTIVFFLKRELLIFIWGKKKNTILLFLKKDIFLFLLKKEGEGAHPEPSRAGPTLGPKQGPIPGPNFPNNG